MKTQSRTEYLMECLSFHEKRVQDCYDKWWEKGDWTAQILLVRKYHERQVKWFLKKLSEPVHSTLKVAPKPDFDKPFRDSFAASESLPKSEEPVTKKPQYPEEAIPCVSFKLNMTKKEFEDFYENEPPQPTKPTFFSRLWNVFKRK